MVKKHEISLIICTHNRAELLDESLKRYCGLITDHIYEILVVLNACSDHSEKIVQAHQKLNSHIHIVKEPKLGHSKARNTGFEAAQAPFVFYIDDDAYPKSNLIDRLMLGIQNKGLTCISGRTLFWDKGSPKWIRPEFVEVPKFKEEFGTLPAQAYINGCACGFYTKDLRAMGGFNQQLGMTGKQLGYFDEIYMQELYKKNGMSIYYDPDLLVYHRSHHQTVVQFLRAAYTKGQNESSIKTKKYFVNLRRLLFEGVIGLVSFPVYSIKWGIKAASVKCFKESATLIGKF